MATLATDLEGKSKIPAAAWVALGLMMAANTLNYLDRAIVSILAQAIKADLKLDDAELGFLLGTAFAVFYSVVGIAMGRITDFLPRKKVMAAGLALWSVMTALGGMATSFAMLGTARIGVGIGEAVANPSGHSLVSDVFPQRNRAMALSVVLTGTFIGQAGALVVGGLILQHWNGMCTSIVGGSLCWLAPWKAALVIVGLPGIPLALLLLTIREPARPLLPASTLQVIASEMSSALPPFTLFSIARFGGKAALQRNVLLIGFIALIGVVLIALTHDKAQWIAFGIGAYSIITWAQVMSHRDKPLFRLTFGDPTFLTAVGATSVNAIIGGTVGVWAPAYLMRTFHLTPAHLGAVQAPVQVLGGLLGVLSGGWLTDVWKRSDPRAPVGVGMITVIGLVPSILVMMTAPSPTVFFAGYFWLSFFGAFWSGSTASMVQDLVLPRMRGAAAAAYALVAIVIAAAIGPYWAGKVSVLTGSLNAGLLSILVLVPLSLLLLWLTARRLPSQTPEARLAIARAAGEPV